MKLLNEAQIVQEWSPIIQESTGVSDKGKLNWLSKYCHFHTLNESSYLGDGAGFMYPQASLQNVPGMGNVVAPQAFGNTGSGDKFPSLLPLAIQVGARTVGFDIVPVIPMNGPTGVLTYMDYVYAGGKNTAGANPLDKNAENPILIKAEIDVEGSTGLEVGKAYKICGASAQELDIIYVGKSFITGEAIFRVLKPGEKVKTHDADHKVEWITSGSTAGYQVADAFQVENEISEGDATVATIKSKPSLVKALEDHVQGFAGAGSEDMDAWTGNFINPEVSNAPMRRGIGEQTYYRTMGLETFTKLIEAQTYQVAGAVTTEQIQDLNRQFGIDVVGMVENNLVNEISQSINKHILGTAFALGWYNHVTFSNVEGQNMNLNLDATEGSEKAEKTFVGKKGDQYVPYTMGVGKYIVAGGFENLSTIQRRVQGKILAAGNIIAQRGRRGAANFVVTNLQIASILQDSAQFQFAPMANTINQSNGTLYPVGSLAGMAIYVDPNMEWTDTRVLVGRKGADEEPGLKYMPYIMAEKSQTIAEGTMAPKIAIKSRYALVEAGFHPETMYFTFYVNIPEGGLI